MVVISLTTNHFNITYEAYDANNNNKMPPNNKLLTNTIATKIVTYVTRSTQGILEFNQISVELMGNSLWSVVAENLCPRFKKMRLLLKFNIM